MQREEKIQNKISWKVNIFALFYPSLILWSFFHTLDSFILSSSLSHVILLFRNTFFTLLILSYLVFFPCLVSPILNPLFLYPKKERKVKWRGIDPRKKIFVKVFESVRSHWRNIHTTNTSHTQYSSKYVSTNVLREDKYLSRVLLSSRTFLAKLFTVRERGIRRFLWKSRWDGKIVKIVLVLTVLYQYTIMNVHSCLSWSPRIYFQF